MSSFPFSQPVEFKEEVIKGFVVAGTTSGSGKTTIALGFLAALTRRGYRVAPFKVGPDFIDPGHHTRIAGSVSRNLDGWMLSDAYNRDSFARHARVADVAVVEGVMGLFDGRDGKSEAGSTAEMAKRLNLPVILVVNARSMARSAAALVQGFENFDQELKFAGVLFNNIGSPRHLRYLNEALENHVRMPSIGGIPRQTAITIPERHLGLYTPADHTLSEDVVAQLADLIEDNLDLDVFLRRLNDHHPVPVTAKEGSLPAIKHTGSARIGVARDNAFCFYYQDNLDLLVAAGAQLVFFSPMNDADLPAGLDGLYLGGGYPELFAPQLSQNRSIRESINRFSAAGMPIYGECGGMMYLGAAITDLEGIRHPMTNCFPLETRMLTRLKSLGYREVRLTHDSLFGASDLTIRGHEFHYSEITAVPESVETVYSVTGRADGPRFSEGYRVKNTLGSYVHLHFGSQSSVSSSFINSCLAYKNERKPVR
jgi:cobyrinic acid a,c-diamide synthase